MGAFNLGNVGDISSLDDIPKIRQYLYRLNEQLRYMFDNLSPEDNYGDKALLQYVSDGEKQSALEISLDQISLSMVDKDNIVAAINMSKEQVQIQADKIKMEGLVTVNSYFKIGLDGSIEARNGKFSGKITASKMESSTIDSTTMTLGGNGKDGKILVYNENNVLMGQWDKTGIDVRKGTMKGTAIELGGNGEPGTLTVKNGSNTTIGTWTKDGIDVKQGSITGTGITLGGSGTAGTLTVKNASNTTIGTWTKDGIDVKQGSITGTGITLGGSGTAGTLTVKNASNTTIGTWTKDGIDVKQGSITGTNITLGGNGLPGSMSVLDSLGNAIGGWNTNGITVLKGVLDIKRGSDFGIYANGNLIRLGDFEVNDKYGRQIIESDDEVTGMGGEPDEDGRMFLWAGCYGDEDETAFYVDNSSQYGYGNTVINGGLFIKRDGTAREVYTFIDQNRDRIVQLEDRCRRMEDSISDLEDAVFGPTA